MKPTYREKHLLDFFLQGSGPPLKSKSRCARFNFARTRGDPKHTDVLPLLEKSVAKEKAGDGRRRILEGLDPLRIGHWARDGGYHNSRKLCV